ncbi:Alpha/beta hydrolase family protein [Nonomuraea coxensis DSM 45129]|uniref:Alpha/beta hydrolase family protein n=1 Tax=Nonomuraea coxensis DSM 45129 TaxID=1122611 RepID=A0ABX8UD69_9ACTN|nr:alpha/beta fold hydrolase [Nonomuraea coxensis]QYC45401.1 Alpha/beta hydrolase family protein [Nonomuraea coxensis DSM 45129]
MRKLVSAAGLVVTLAASAACGSGGGTGAAPAPATPTTATTPANPATPATTSAAPSSPPPTGPNVSGCFTEADGKIFEYGGGLPGVIAGTGSTGVVITYERRGNVCAWRPLSDRLVAAGYRVLLYARSAVAAPGDTTVAMAKRLAKEKGVERVFLAGGSIGATVAATAALELGPDRIAGVVALSGEIAPEDAAKLTVPLLQVGSEHDDYGGRAALDAARAAATKSPDAQVLVIPGERLHASELFASPYADQVLDTVETFMNRHKG